MVVAGDHVLGAEIHQRPIARPWSPCRNTASLPETPCALTTADAGEQDGRNRQWTRPRSAHRTPVYVDACRPLMPLIL